MIVFTNGCFDILHPGHVHLLEEAKKLGTRLIVGINSDSSVRKIKGVDRPVMDQESRRSMLLALSAVDEVRIFDGLTPERLIKEIRPDVLVKGGDWKTGEVVGASFVESYGGTVVSVPLVGEYSTSGIIEQFCNSKIETEAINTEGVVETSLRQHSDLATGLDDQLIQSIYESSAIMIETLVKGGKIFTCGNGGSAADAQHLAAELTGRYETDRQGLAAIALTTDTSAITAIANDFGYQRVFSRQIEALASKGDCLIAISTSGSSESIIEAVMAARLKGCKVVGLTGAAGKKLASLSDSCLMIPSTRTARIQELHIMIAHIWCELIDQSFAAS